MVVSRAAILPLTPGARGRILEWRAAGRQQKGLAMIRRLLALAVPALFAALPLVAAVVAQAPPAPTAAQIAEAFGKQGIRLSAAEAARIRPNVLRALSDARAGGIGNSKVGFAAVEIASDLGLDTSAGSNAVKNVQAAIAYLVRPGLPQPPPGAPLEWEDYFRRTTNLVQQPDFMQIVSEQKFFPVKISWEDIGRYQNSAWGDRISDVGIWVRLVESEPSSAKLALSVRRDSNFRDKVLVVPADRIKIHRTIGGRTEERTLPQRLGELGLSSPNRDRNVILSNQFAIVPVPARTMRGAWADGHPPRAAFTFSIFPYGSTNYVITDVIEGSSEAVVGPGNHQLLFSNVNGQKAPFTASRAADRPDLLKMESDLKAAGMDVDVQRYYLIQVPLRRDARGIQLSNMGAPPFERMMPVPAPYAGMPAGMAAAGATKQAPVPSAAERQAGLDKVAIGHGEVEGPYFGGAGYRGARADEPIRVTVVYFVTPIGAVTRADMANFAKAFAAWDGQAIWGGSFVVKEK
jgi:hypothetical protein